MATQSLRSRKPYSFNAEDEEDEGGAPVILDPQEQSEIVEDVIAQASRSFRWHMRVVLALQVSVFFLLLAFSRNGVPTFLFSLSLLFPMFRLFLATTTASAAAPTDFEVAYCGGSVIAPLYNLATSSSRDAVAWSTATSVVQLVGLLVHWDAARGLRDAQDLKKLMYNAPQA